MFVDAFGEVLLLFEEMCSVYLAQKVKKKVLKNYCHKNSFNKFQDKKIHTLKFINLNSCTFQFKCSLHRYNCRRSRVGFYFASIMQSRLL